MTFFRTAALAGTLVLSTSIGALAQATGPTNSPSRPTQGGSQGGAQGHSPAATGGVQNGSPSRGTQGQSPTAMPNAGENSTINDPARPTQRGSQQAPTN